MSPVPSCHSVRTAFDDEKGSIGSRRCSVRTDNADLPEFLKTHNHADIMERLKYVQLGQQDKRAVFARTITYKYLQVALSSLPKTLAKA